MTQVPICKDCRYFRKGNIFSRGACLRDAWPAVNIVSGRTNDGGVNHSCDKERAPLSWCERLFGTSRCGPDGSLFEPGEPIDWSLKRAPPPIPPSNFIRKS